MLHVKYPIPIEGAKMQSTNRADRRHCALTAALAALGRDENLSFSGCRNPTFETFKQSFYQLDVPLPRAALWARGVNLEPGPYAYADSVLGYELSEYQRDAINKMTIAGGVLALDTGLGKTLSTVSILEGVSKVYGNRCFICCPVNAFGAWEPYVEHLKTLFKEVSIVSIDSLHKLKGLSAAEGGAIVWDEAHLLGVSATKRTREAHELRRCFDYGIGLTGTLLHGGVEKALSALDLSIPGSALFSSFWTAGDHFKCIVRKEVPGRGSVASLEKPTKASFEAFCAFLARTTVIVKKHSEVAKEASIPPQDIETIQVGEPWLDVRELAIAWAREYIEEHGEMPQAQACAAGLRREGLDSKIEWLTMFLQSNADEPVVLFAWSLESLERLRTLLESMNMEYAYVDGSVTGKNRIAAKEAFQGGKVNTYLGQIDASCASIDLFRSHISIAIEHTNRSANYDQALGRTCRRGQIHRCTHYDVVSNSLQSKVLSRIRAGMDFDASVAEWIVVRDTLKSMGEL